MGNTSKVDVAKNFFLQGTPRSFADTKAFRKQKGVWDEKKYKDELKKSELYQRTRATQPCPDYIKQLRDPDEKSGLKWNHSNSLCNKGDIYARLFVDDTHEQWEKLSEIFEAKAAERWSLGEPIPKATPTIRVKD